MVWDKNNLPNLLVEFFMIRLCIYIYHIWILRTWVEVFLFEGDEVDTRHATPQESTILGQVSFERSAQDLFWTDKFCDWRCNLFEGTF